MDRISTAQERRLSQEEDAIVDQPTPTSTTVSSPGTVVAASPPSSSSSSDRVHSSRPGLDRHPLARSSGPVQGAKPASTSPGKLSRTSSSPYHGSVDARKETAAVAKEDAPNDEAGDSISTRDMIDPRLISQTRPRKSHGGPGVVNPSGVFPISEEEGATAPMNRPSLTGHSVAARHSISTASTASTESVRTVKAGATPMQPEQPLRTPSYPFPYVPRTPKGAPAGSHQPFTALSPTIHGPSAHVRPTPGAMSFDSFSGMNTPAAARAFLPPGAQSSIVEDPRFPTPSLYDLVLQLNAEPGLEPWWATTANIVHDHFKASRATIVVPMDPTELETVPWGQKATFCMTGPQAYFSKTYSFDQTGRDTTSSGSYRSDTSKPLDGVTRQKLHRERLRPRLESRHSYAGHGRETRESYDLAPGKLNVRPQGPIRTATHAAGTTLQYDGARITENQFPITSAPRQDSSSSQTLESSSSTDSEPYAEVFSSPKRLDHEIRPLIDPGGVNRVLERGRVVVVTRDYKQEPVLRPLVSNVDPRETLYHSSARAFDNFRSDGGPDRLLNAIRDYEEYEQHPHSPWAQSPAPSPAIQADEDENPFFRSEQQTLEDSFNPVSTPRDYSQLGQVEAIGVDGVSTVIHIPLFHPLLSRPLPTTASRSGQDPPSSISDVPGMDRQSPIAILSILSSVVPYPHNLVQSLKLLGPHLATSLSVAQQFSATFSRNILIEKRRTASGNLVDFAPLSVVPTITEDETNAAAQDASDILSAATTSPSEYSTQSKQSPSSSIVGTPGWDPATHGWASSRSATETPVMTGTEMVDNYFDARKRGSYRPTSNTSQPSSRTPRKSSGTEIKSEGRKNSPSPEEEFKQSRIDRKTKLALATDNKPPEPQTQTQEQSPIHSTASDTLRPPLLAQGSERRHSLLHSYGADYTSTFGFPSASALEPRTPGLGGHARKGSYPEDMPPPSERLLRTIIDSVPVQIFTAEPETGKLTWVNSKFLVYRGLEPRQVMSNPWNAIHPSDREEFMTSWHRSLRTYQQLQQKVRLERFDGTYRWFYVRAAPLKDKRQNIVHWIGTMMDFHEQHIAEINLSRQQETVASEAKYRALANSSPQIVFAANKIKGVTFCNTQWLDFSGQTESQALGVGFMDHVHPDDLTKCRLPTSEEFSEKLTDEPTTTEPKLNRSASASAASSSGSSETEKGVTSASSSSSPATHLPQRKLSEMVSTGILKVTRDADGRPSYSTEVRLKSKDGDYRWHLVRLLLAEPFLQTENDEAEIWYGTCTDINDHKTLERDLKETMDEKSRFLSNMSHEIRTPLNGITGMVNFLIDSNLTPEQLEHVNIIRASTEGLRDLINDILDLSKAEAGMIQLKMDWLYIRALIEEVNDLTSAMAIDKGLELNYVVDEELPTQVKGDRFRMRQILLNIVGNAIKFTSRGEVFVRCSVQKASSKDLASNELLIKFETIDTGRGFSEKEAESLFKRFSQIDGNNARQHGGTGLGLVISRQLTQLHGGEMSAKSVPGRGSTFTFYVKVTLPTKDDEPPAPQLASTGATIPILPPPAFSPVVTPGATASPSALRPSRNLFFPTPSEAEPRASPKFLKEHTQSPGYYLSSPDAAQASPSPSSAGSDPSIRSAARTSSLRSERSSASSILPEAMPPSPPLNLTLPAETKTGRRRSHDASLKQPIDRKASSPGTTARMYSILVVAPLPYSREATVHHINKTLPTTVPHQITARESVAGCIELIRGDEPVLFTHVVLVLQDEAEVIALIDEILSLQAYQQTSIVVITNLAQRRRIIERARKFPYARLAEEQRLHFVFKPLKPSRFASIFDPQQESEMSTDRNQHSARQAALNHKQVFEELSRRLGNCGKRVLLVEDDRMNQLVVIKFLAKCSITAEKAQDGVECLERVFSHPPGYYSMILCDLHMPNKDGYQTCKEIRRWERRNKHPHVPITAMSANVLGNVYQKCVDAGFNSYLTKPVDFTEFSQVLIMFMDPSDPTKPHEFMKKKDAVEPGEGSA